MMQKILETTVMSQYYIYIYNYVLAVTASSRIKNFSCVSGIILHATTGFNAPNASQYF